MKFVCLILMLVPMAGTAWAALPPGWSDADIGSPGLAGSASYASGLWTVTGGGSDIWNAGDQFNFASTNYSGDGTMIVQVTSLQNSDPGSGWSKAGLMFRNDSTAGSANVSIVATAGQGISFQWRSAAGGSSSNSADSGINAPVWLKLVHSSPNFTGYYSTDGSNWVQVGSQQVALNNTVMAGLDVTAHNNSALNTATFTNFSLFATPPPGTANVIINTSGNLAVVPATGYGIHTSVYAGIFGDASLPGALSRGGISTLRYPGGGYTDIFHWSVSRAALGQNNGFGFTPWWGQSNNYGWMNPNTDFGSFVTLLANAHCQALITVNFGGGQKWTSSAHTSLTIPTTNAEPPEAAAWVAYANANTNIYGTANDVTLGTDSQGNNWQTAGYWAMMRAAAPLGTDDGYNFLRISHPAPIGIKYWEIGNETFGTGYYDSGGGNGYCLNYAVQYPSTNYPRYGNPNLSPAAYGRGVKSFSLLMKAVDPTIKIGAVVSTPPGDYGWDSYGGQRWTPQVLAQCATNIDFVIPHSYPWIGTLDDGSQTLSIPGSLYPAMVNGTGSHTPGSTAGLRDEIAAYRADATNVQIFITEFGYNGSLTNSINGEPITGPVNTLFAADSYATWLELGVDNIDFLELSVDSFLGTVATPGGVYYGVQMTHAMAGPGDQLVVAASDTPTLRSHAAVQQAGKIGVLLLNENRTSSVTVNVSIPSVSLAGAATQTQFGINNFSGGSNVPLALPTTNTISVSGNSLTVTLPAYTMAELTIPVSGNTPPVLAAVPNYTVNVGQTVAFTASATDTDQPPQTLIFSLLSGPGNATLNTNTGAFSWRPAVSDANTTSAFVLKVTDNGSPSLSATQGFTVTVNSLTQPTATSIALNNGQLGFLVSGQAGPDYAVQASSNLVDWNTLLVTNSPAMPFSWLDTNAATLPAQFYRIKVGPPLP